MAIGTRALASACAGAILVSSCSEPPSVAPERNPSAPSVWALVLEVTADEVRLLSARPTRGAILRPRFDERIGSIRSGGSLWLEYQLTASAPGEVLGQGAFIVSMDAIFEDPDDEGSPGIARVASRVVSISVPYFDELDTLAFSRVEPSDVVERDEWERVPVGTVSLDDVRDE